MKIGIISNPLSERNKGRGSRLDAAVAGEADVLHESLTSMDDLRPILQSFAAREVGTVIVDGGDGTVQATLGALLEDSAFETPPDLALLPSGMTNVIAKDVGLSGRPGPAVAALIRRIRSDEGTAVRADHRHVMRMTHAPDRPALYGMFFATGAVYRAIEVCRRTMHPLGIKSSAAVGLTLAGLVARRMLFRKKEDEVYRGDEMSIRWDQGDVDAGTNLLVLASTLAKLTLGSAPFWGEEPGDVRVSLVSFPPKRFVRSVLPFLKGGPRERLPETSYRSRNASVVTFDMACPFTLDGELFDPVPGVPVTLEAAGPVRFVR